MNIELISLLVSVFTAIIALFIAYKQKTIDHYKFKHDLFDRRMKVFDATHGLLNYLASNTKLDENVFQNFLAVKDKAHFLFNPKVAKKIDDYFDVAFEYRYS